MSGILPSASGFRKQVGEYVADTKRVVDSCVTSGEHSESFTQIYKTSLATDTVLASLSSPKLAPNLASARSIALRIPLLVIIGQSSAALTELRRFIELTLWTLYFSDHSIEWKEFISGSGGFSRDTSKPISFAAHRELNYYLGYAKELMASEQSGIALEAISNIDTAKKTLNSFVHAGHMARSTLKIPPYDSVKDKDLKAFARLQSATFSNCCVALAAYRRERFNKMTAIARAYFDLLVGSAVRKEIRSGPFGL